MFKKLIVATSLVASISVLADPILLPGGVSVPNPATPNASFGTGNVVNSLDFVQFFENDSGEIVNIGTSLNDISTLNGYGTLQSTGDAGGFLCPSCTLAFEFGGLNIVQSNLPNFFTPGAPVFDLEPTGSFFNVYIVDEISNALSLTDILVNGSGDLNTTAAEDFIDENTDTLFLSGTFSEFNYIPEFSQRNFDLGALGAGTLTAGISINEMMPGEGIANDNIVSDSVTQSDLSQYFDAVAFSLSSTFFTVGGGTTTVSQDNDGNFSATVVSTPATLGLFGLALIGMGLFRRNKIA